MTDKLGEQDGGQPTDDKRMTPEEIQICQKIASYQKPYSLRAQALVALEEGSTQAHAAEQSGLTLGQVRYWSDKFARLRIGIFPKELVNEARVSAGIPHPPKVAEEVEKPAPLVKEPSPTKLELVPEPAETALVLQPEKQTAMVPIVESKPGNKKKKKKKKVKKEKKLLRKKGTTKGKKKRKKKGNKNGKKSLKNKPKKDKKKKGKK